MGAKYGGVRWEKRKKKKREKQERIKLLTACSATVNLEKKVRERSPDMVVDNHGPGTRSIPPRTLLLETMPPSSSAYLYSSNPGHERTRLPAASVPPARSIQSMASGGFDRVDGQNAQIFIEGAPNRPEVRC